MFSFHQRIDKAVVRPAAMGVKHVVPKPVRSGLRNFFRNLSEPLVFLNDLLQLRPKRAARTFFRFALNSTIGVAGFIDVAKGENVPHRDNSLGDTLAYYGVGPGPYLFIPFGGPTTLRDLLGGQGERVLLPVMVGTPFDRAEYQASEGVLTGLDERIEADSDLKALFDSAVDPYATLRSVYLQDRKAHLQALKAKGKGEAVLPDVPFDEPLQDPATSDVLPKEAPQSTLSSEPPPASEPQSATANY